MRRTGMRLRTRHAVAARRVVAGAALVAMLAGCGDDTVSQSPITLSGHAYVASTAKGFELPAGSQLRLTFDGLRLRMSGGCNSGSADYRLVDGQLVMEPMAMTEMACNQDLMGLDTAASALLLAKPSVRLSGDELTITSGDKTLVLIDNKVANPDFPLEGTTWTVHTVVHEGLASSVSDLATVRIVDGIAYVNAGCNTGSAPVTINETALDVGQLVLTEATCADSAMQLEWAVASVLQGSVPFQIDSNQLTMSHGDWGIGLRAEPQG